jgi:hypothetical protein
MVTVWLTFVMSSTIKDAIRQGHTVPSMALAGAGTNSIREGRVLCSGAWAQAGCLAQQVKHEPIDKYHSSSNPEEFIQIYHMIIEGAGGDDWVKYTYLPTDDVSNGIEARPSAYHGAGNLAFETSWVIKHMAR